MEFINKIYVIHYNKLLDRKKYIVNYFNKNNILNNIHTYTSKCRWYHHRSQCCRPSIHIKHTIPYDSESRDEIYFCESGTDFKCITT